MSGGEVLARCLATPFGTTQFFTYATFERV